LMQLLLTYAWAARIRRRHGDDAEEPMVAGAIPARPKMMESTMSGRRTSFYFPKEAMAALGAIQRRTRLDNGADVIRIAVITYWQILHFIDDGHKIVVRDKAGDEFPYSPYRPFEYPGLITPTTDQESEQSVSPKSFFFSGDIVTKLDEIRARGYVRTNSDAIRVALAAYRELISVVSAGDEIIVRQRDGQEFSFDPDAPYASPVLSQPIQPHAELVDAD